ncbi:MAG: serine/threonine protein kinase [Deltaproteobacteria bacterium]|nr:serine/threonine protein kinase [Deltaproteobacteria bacterium]
MRQCPRCSSRYEDAVGFCPRDGTGLEELKDSLIGQEVGHYRISSLIGEGGMGAVYLAVHPGIGSRVAVKVLHPELARDRAAVDRFFAEARSVNLIHHENIVNILDLAQLADGRSYIVMEYLEGESVAARLRKKGPFTPKEAVALMLPVLAALQAAHEHGIIHRDLKPDNIYLTRGGQVKVLDFGIAKLDIAHGGGAATRTGAILGTPMYMSPEQAAGRASQVDHRSDIYSAGIILHELCAGRVPFLSEALYDLITKHLTEPPTPLRQLKPEAPAELEAAVLRALAKEPERRFDSVEEMKRAMLG